MTDPEFFKELAKYIDYLANEDDKEKRLHLAYIVIKLITQFGSNNHHG